MSGAALAEPGKVRTPVGGAAPCLYVGWLDHRRFEPRPRVFRRTLHLVSFDADRPGDLDRFPLWSSRGPALVRYDRRDYLDGRASPLGEAVRDLVEGRTGTRPGEVRVLTQLRTLGFLFNPLTMYHCRSAETGALTHLVLEVTNTPWHERCWYVVAVDPARPHGPWSFPKAMHVSPFLPMALSYQLRAGDLAERFGVSLQDRDGDRVVFEARMSLRRAELTRRSALGVLLRYPAQTWRTSAAIYLHAARLGLRGVRIHPHPHPRPRRGDPTQAFSQGASHHEPGH